METFSPTQNPLLSPPQNSSLHSSDGILRPSPIRSPSRSPHFPRIRSNRRFHIPNRRRHVESVRDGGGVVLRRRARERNGGINHTRSIDSKVAILGESDVVLHLASPEMEKRSVGVFHELLSLSIYKRGPVPILGKFCQENRFSNAFSSVFTRHSGIFCMSRKGGIRTAMLREAYNDMSCFQGLFFCPEAATLLLHNFCIYHISHLGHELGAGAVCSNDPVPSVDDLADQILEVLNYFRFVMLHGCVGFYVYGIFERLEGWPAMSISQGRTVFKLHDKLFQYMAVSDERQRIMPTSKDREKGHVLAYPEAVLLTDPANVFLRGEVDDKYQYSSDNKDGRVHGWICSDPPTGFWIITPSNEFKTGGPVKQDLTSHAGPISLSMFFSTHYEGLPFILKFGDGEPWKKVFGPPFIYLNSVLDDEE